MRKETPKISASSPEGMAKVNRPHMKVPNDSSIINVRKPDRTQQIYCSPQLCP
jgi:hypothetical protein